MRPAGALHRTPGLHPSLQSSISGARPNRAFMIEHAICIRCGAEKAHPFDRCGDCHFEPTPDSDDAVRSLYFSEYRFSDPDAMERWLEELESIAPKVKQGAAYEFDSAELKRLHSVARALAAQPAAAANKALLRFFAPAIALLVVLFGLYLWLRLSR